MRLNWFSSASGTTSPAPGPSFKYVTDTTFNRMVVANTKPVVVIVGSQDYPNMKDFFTHLEPLAQGSDVDVVIADPTKNPAFLHQYQIQSVPTTMLFRNGKAVSEMLIGQQTTDTMNTYLRRHQIIN